MWLLIAEAFIALAMFIFIVWWTMSSRRRSDAVALPLAAAVAPPAVELAPATDLPPGATGEQAPAPPRRDSA